MAYIIASSKLWNENLIGQLQATTGETFHLITQKDQLTTDYLESIKPKAIFFPHWSYLIKKEVYTNYECIVFHMTDLPYGRGGSPLQNLILKGHKRTMISAIKCESGIDTGPIYLKSPLNLEGRAQDIYERASATIQQMIEKIIRLKPAPQPQEGEVTLFKRRTPTESEIKSLQTLEQLYDFIRMLDADGYPQAFIESNGFRYEFHEGTLQNGELMAKVRIKKI